MTQLVERIVAGLFLIVLGAGAVAQDNGGRLDFGGDRFIAGRTAASGSAVAGDLFLAGERVRADASVGGSAHMAGRIVTQAAEVAGALYAAGYEVRLDGGVGGNATLAGAEVAVTAPVGGNLRATASDLRLQAPVGGAALLAGGDVQFDADITGDVQLVAEELEFGPNARVGGMLLLSVPDPDAVDVPERVAPAERVTVVALADADRVRPPEGIEQIRRRGVVAVIWGWLTGVAVMALTAALAVAVAPGTVAAMRRRALAMPARCLAAGFVAMSGLIGAVLVLAVTLVGLLVVPAAALLAALMIYAGYVAGAYVLGVGIWTALGRDVPEAVLPKAGLAFLGAVIAGLVFLLPVLGWLGWFVLVFIGLGAIAAPILARLGALSEAGA